MGRPLRSALPPLLLALMLAACGGGGGGSNNANSQPSTAVSAQEPNAPQAIGNTATDGFNWFNFRRQQLGVQQVLRNARVDAAAQSHSDYQKANNAITHEQIEGRPGFTGRTAGDRLAAAGYQFSPNASYAYGEVISATSDPSGFNAAEDLVAAIYHRFVIFEPMFKEAGAGAAAGGGTTYFTTNFVANGLDSGLGSGAVVIYPFANQQRVRRNFFSDHEAPDPVPDRNEVGYPISVHANITAVLSVQSFNVRPRGGAPLESLLLTRARDPQTPLSAAAIIPLSPLAPATTYDVQFSGKVDGTDVVRSWSFTTQ
ncbi:MAG: CAP domain-containing protein [Noviherbaspirillum sp.]